MRRGRERRQSRNDMKLLCLLAQSRRCEAITYKIKNMLRFHRFSSELQMQCIANCVER